MTMQSPTSTSTGVLTMQAVRGFCMGVADLVPGVSGGTIALILGIYNRLVANIRKGAGATGRILKLDVRGAVDELKSVEWSFLLPLLAGIGIAVVTLSHFIEELLIDHPEPMAGLFLGLVAASVFMAWKMVSDWKTDTYAMLALAAVASFVILGFQSGTISSPSPAEFLGAGAIAICAMILPGISGSFLLLMLGMYVPLLAAVNEREVPDLAVFGVGAVIGMALFSTLLGWLLENHNERVLAGLVGLMVGSVRVLWPWPRGVGVISDAEEELVSGTDLGWPTNFADFFWPTVLAGIAFVAVAGLSLLADRRSASARESEAAAAATMPGAD